MKSSVSSHKKWLSLILAMAMCLSLVSLPAAAEEASAPVSSFLNTSEDGGSNAVSLTAERTFKAMLPVDMTLEQAKTAATSAVWSLVPDSTQDYLDDTLYPYQTKGGPLDTWVCADEETPLFTDLASSAEVVNGQVYLTLTFANKCYFLDDFSAPHINGGYYIDVCGYFNLTAETDGKALGSVGVKVAPYDQFNTMAEIYDELDEMVSFAAEKTNLYVEEFSMGMSQGDNGMKSLDMPYLIIAKDKAAVENWKKIKAEAESDPSALIAKIENGNLGSYQVPVMYSNVHANEIAATDGIMAFGWMLLNAAAGNGTMDYDVLTGFTSEGKAELAAQMGPKGQEGSVAVPDLVADTATYLGYIKGKNEDGTTSDISIPVDLKKYYTMKTETVKVDDLLSDVFFILVPEENVEGRTYLTRTSSGGFDLNRDNSFQTQAETQNMTSLIAQWNPVSFVEFHGRVETFQCEPCDPPHEPNFEYDLLANHLMTGGEALAIAAVANNKGHNSYVIPQRDYLKYNGKTNTDGTHQTQWFDPWDDMSTSYTPQYAMLHGIASYTVEVPAYDDHMVTALAYGQLGQSRYIADNKDSYLLSQTKIYERGVTNANSNAYELVGQWFADQYDVEGAEMDVFRPEYDGEGQNGNFYPECYIIPTDGTNQGNLQAANDMLTYLHRNGVKVMTADKAFTYNGVEYPAGTAVVSMYQAKRSVANGVLYDGTVITEWPVLYSEGITAFDHTRGFDMITCAEPAAYKTITAACSVSDKWEVSSAFTGITGEKVILSNASEHSTSAVNDLLRAGKNVAMILTGEDRGSFLVDYSDWQSVSSTYLLTGKGISASQLPMAMTITKAPTIYISGKPSDDDSGFVKTSLISGAPEYNYDRQSMELLGFTVTENPTEADLIIGAAALDDQALAAVKSGTPYIGYGYRAMKSAVSLFPEGALEWETAGESAMDALAYVTYPTDSLVTASYVTEGDDLLYGYGAGYFSAIPDGARILVRLDSSKELLEGFLPSTGEHYDDFLNNSIQAIEYHKDGLNLVFFANTLTNKVHQRDEFSFISNTAFSSLLGDVYNSTAGSSFLPEETTNRSSLVSALHQMAGSPEAGNSAGFPDVSNGDQYADAVNWAASTGVVQGYNGSFYPNSPLTREQAAVMLYNYARTQNMDVSSKSDLSGYSDVNSISNYASDAMAWAVEAGLITGRGGSLAPQAPTTRAELSRLVVQAVNLLSTNNP